MQLHLLGTAGYHPNSRRHTACFMLPEIGVVLDAGTGFYRVRDLVQTETLDIFLSHAHLDHVFGLSFLFDTVYEKPVREVRVHGEAAKLAAVRQYLLADELFPAALPCSYLPLSGPLELPGGGRLTYFPLVHPGGSVGYRLDWPGHSLAYVTDTTAADATYVKHLAGVELLLHECNFVDGMEEWAVRTGHSCLTPVAQVARAAHVGRLILVHVNPLDELAEPLDISSVRHIFPRVEIGQDGQVVEF